MALVGVPRPKGGGGFHSTIIGRRGWRGEESREESIYDEAYEQNKWAHAARPRQAHK